MYCPNCGSENKGEAKFCRQCGNAVIGSIVRETGKVVHPRRRPKKMIAICIVVAVMIAITALIGTSVDFKKLILNDFEYYLYLEKKNAESFVGEKFIALTENYNSFSAESSLTGSISGSAPTYNYNNDIRQLAAILEQSALMLKTDYNGKDTLNIDADWLKKGGTEILDLIITVLNGDLVLASDSLSNNSYSLLKTINCNNISADITTVVKNLLLAIYEHFGGFEDYISVESIKYGGEKATKMTFDFHYVFIAELTDFVVDYWLSDAILMNITEQIFVMMNELWGENLYEELREDGYSSFKEALSDELQEEIEYAWWIDDKLEIKYEIIYNKKGNIQKRELTLIELEDDIEQVFTCDTRIDSAGDQIFEFTTDGYEFAQIDNSGDKFSAIINLDDDIKWDLTLSYNQQSIDFNFYGVDNYYYCGYNSNTEEYLHGTLVLKLDLKTEFNKYAFTSNEAIMANAKAFRLNDFVNVIEVVEQNVEYAFEDEFD